MPLAVLEWRHFLLCELLFIFYFILGAAMKRRFLIVFLLCIPVSAQAELNINGNSECTSISVEYPKNVSKRRVNQSIDFTLYVDKQTSRFKRVSDVLLTAKTLVVEKRITEEGTINIESNKIYFYPLSADVEIIKGRELLKEGYMEIMMDSALENESGTIEIKDEITFTYQTQFLSGTSIVYDCTMIK